MKKIILTFFISMLSMSGLFATYVKPKFVGPIIELGATAGLYGALTLKPKPGIEVKLESYSASTGGKLGVAMLPAAGMTVKYDDGYAGHSWYTISCKVGDEYVKCSDVLEIIGMQEDKVKGPASPIKHIPFEPLFMQR